MIPQKFQRICETGSFSVWREEETAGKTPVETTTVGLDPTFCELQWLKPVWSVARFSFVRVLIHVSR
jgi:hypothetical protein